MISCIEKIKRMVTSGTLAALVVLGVVACGGAGGGGGGTSASSNASGSTGTPVATSATTSMTGTSTSKVIDPTQSGAVTVASTTAIDGSTQSTITLPADLAKSMAVQTGSTLVIPAGQGTQFPLGLAALVGKTSADPVTGQVTAEVTPPTLQDAYTKLTAQGSDIPLSADNFVGAIAPFAISGGNATPTARQTGLLRQTGEVKVFNGALTLTTSKPTGMQAGLEISKPDLAFGEINLVTEVKLKDLLTESEASTYQPYGKSGEAKVSISIKISDLMLTQRAEFEEVLGVPYKLKSLDYKLKGALAGETKLVGGLSGDLGYYSRAWNETEVQALTLLGVSGKLLGLETKDKIGKIPLAGLVFSIPCAATTTCPVLPGVTQTPIRQAAAGGVIVWLYLNAKGQITFEGSVGARINAGFEIGAEQPAGGKLTQALKFFKKAQDKNLLEVPFVQGELKAQANLGISMDADAFLGGVRFLNLALDAGAQANLNVNAQIANVLPDVGQPWQWQGTACMTTSVGAGVVANLRIGVGGEVNTGWQMVDDKLTGRLTYEKQSPTESERAAPGTHDALGIPLWYTYLGKAMCFPAPMVETSSLSLNGTAYNWVVTGTNLPDDLELAVATAGMCGIKPQLSWSVVDAGTKATFACSGLGSVSKASGSFSSAKATNLGGQTQWNWQVGNLPPVACTPPKILQNGQCVTPPPSCTPPQVLQNGQCVTPPPSCTPPQVLQNGQCVTPPPSCTPPQVLQNGQCVTPPPSCTPPQVLQNGQCVTPPPSCTPPQVLQNGQCVTPPPSCTPPQVLQNGQCVTPPPSCTPPQVLQNGQCVTPPPSCTPPQVLQNGQCVTPPPSCTPPQVLQNGQCVTGPTLTGFNLASVVAQNGAQPLTLYGTGFTTASLVRWRNGGASGTLTPTYVSPTQLNISFNTTLTGTGLWYFSVANGTLVSAERSINASAPAATAPTLTGFNLASLVAQNGAQPLTLYGTGFTTASQVKWRNGSLSGTLGAASVTYVSPTQLNISFNTTLTGTGLWYFSVANGTLVSAERSINASAPAATAPTLTGFNLASLVAQNGAQPLTLYGTGFTTASQVKWRNGSLSGTLRAASVTYVSPTQLNISFNTTLTGTGLWYFSVANGTLVSAERSINASAPAATAPTLTGFNLASLVAQNGAQPLILYGTGFTTASQVKWRNGSLSGTLGAASVTYVSPTQLNISFNTTLTGTGLWYFSVANGTLVSAEQSINATAPPAAGPTLTGFNLASLVAQNGAQPLTLYGTGFTTASQVKWRNGSLSGTLGAASVTYVSPTQLNISFNTTLTGTGLWYFSVANGTLVSAERSINASAPAATAPTLTGFNLASLVAQNGAQPLTLYGTGFTTASQVKWRNGSLSGTLRAASVTYVSPTQLNISFNTTLTGTGLWYFSVANGTLVSAERSITSR